MAGRRGKLASAMCLAALTATVSASAEEAPSRPEYVTRLEKICRPGSEATQRAVKGVKADVRHERLRAAAPKVEKAKRIFAKTVSVIAKIPRPAADRSTLSRWFAALGREVTALGQTASALRSNDVPRFERVWGTFVHEGDKANNVVVSFGFDYCDFKVSRFE